MSDSHAVGKKMGFGGILGRDRLRMGGLGEQAAGGRTARVGATSRDDGAIQLVTKTLRRGG
jgi:hypothetical protein